MPEVTGCGVEGCSKPLKRKGFCYSHYMKNYRYGTPTPQHVPKNAGLDGQRFGNLTVIGRENCKWVCRCDCGDVVRTGTNNLVSRGQRSCYTCWSFAQRSDDIGYYTAHSRVTAARGKAAAHACVDCGSAAAQWSYDHEDPDEMVQRIGATDAAYSAKVQHYSPRCVKCHKRFDLDRLDAAKV